MSRKKKTFCPFWSPSDRCCIINQEGLFIPSENHVAMYCKTPDYPLCAQCNGQMSEKVAFYTCVAERRQQHRIVSAHRITVTDPGEAAKDTPVHFLATTIDLSTGGLRLFSKKILRQNATVNFAFDNSFPQHLQSGSATIKWCLPQLNKSGYQSGLSFKEDTSSRSMTGYLGTKT